MRFGYGIFVSLGWFGLGWVSSMQLTVRAWSSAATTLPRSLPASFAGHTRAHCTL